MTNLNKKETINSYIIASRIKEERNKLGFSQMEASFRIGISTQQLQNYESGKNKISIEKLISICKAYSLPVEEIFSSLLEK